MHGRDFSEVAAADDVEHAEVLFAYSLSHSPRDDADVTFQMYCMLVLVSVTTDPQLCGHAVGTPTADFPWYNPENLMYRNSTPFGWELGWLGGR